MHNGLYLLLHYQTVVFSTLKYPMLHLFNTPFFRHLNILSSVSILSSFQNQLAYHVIRIIHYVTFSDWLFYLVLCTKDLSMSFCGLITHFILSLDSVPLYASPAVCLSAHLLKEISFASKFWRSCIQLL